MAGKLSSLRKVTNDGAPRFVIYGIPGIGKTTLASEFPDAVFQQVEDGTPNGVELNSFGLLQTFGDVMDTIGDLYDGDHNFKWVVLDSFSSNSMQRLIFEETCARGDEHGNRKKNIEDFGYGKGYVKAQQVTQELLDAYAALRRDRGMGIIILSHSRIERFDDPESVSYDRYEIDIHDKLRGLIERDVDAILLMKNKVTIQEEKTGFNNKRNLAKGGSSVWVHANSKPAYVAKNRYDIGDFIYERGVGFAELAKYLPPQYTAASSEQAA